MTLDRTEGLPERLESSGTRNDLQEEIVPDGRARLKPSEIVQTKLLSLLPNIPVPVSCLHSYRETRRGLGGLS